MRRMAAMRTSAALVLALWTCNLGAQAPTRVSLDLRFLPGTCVLNITRSGLSAADAEERVISLGPAWLRVDINRQSSAKPVSLIYNLDGAPNVNAFGDGEAVTKLTRDGDVIVMETVFTVNKQAVTLTERVPLVPGLDLPVDVMIRVEHGYQGVATSGTKAPPNTSKGRKIFEKRP